MKRKSQINYGGYSNNNYDSLDVIIICKIICIFIKAIKSALSRHNDFWIEKGLGAMNYELQICNRHILFAFVKYETNILKYETKNRNIKKPA